MDAAGENAHGIAASLKRPALQSYIWKFINGRAKEPRRSSLQPLADHYRVSVEAFYSETKATEVAAERGLLGTPTASLREPDSQPTQPIDVIQAIEVLGAALSAADKATRLAIAPLLSLLAEEPDQLETVTSTVQKLLPRTKLARASQSRQPDERESFTFTNPSLEMKEPHSHAKRFPDKARGGT